MRLNWNTMLLAALWVCAGTLFFAALSFRPMLGDGATAFVHLVQWHELKDYAPHLRYFDMLFQLPALFFLGIFSSENTYVPNLILSLSYSLHPFLSLALTAWILRKKGRPDLLIFPLLSFATATLPSMGFAFSVAPTTLSGMWPLFFLFMLRRKNSAAETALICLLMSALAFSYEPAALFFLLFFAWALRDGWSERFRNPRTLFLLLFSILGATALVYSALLGSTSDRGGFYHALRQIRGPLRIIELFSIALLAPAALIAFLKPRFERWIPLGLFVAGLVFSGVVALALRAVQNYKGPALDLNLGTVVDLFTSTNARATAIPAAFLIAVISLFWIHARRADATSSLERLRRPICALTVVFLFLGAALDFGYTLQWRRSAAFLHMGIQNTKGCARLNWDDYVSFMRPWRPIAGWQTPYTSIALQHTRKPQTVLFVSPDSPSSNPCVGTPLPYGKHTIWTIGEIRLYLAGKIDYAVIREEVKRQYLTRETLK